MFWGRPSIQSVLPGEMSVPMKVEWAVNKSALFISMHAQFAHSLLHKCMDVIAVVHMVVVLAPSLMQAHARSVFLLFLWHPKFMGTSWRQNIGRLFRSVHF